MSVPDPVAEGSFSECEIKEADELRINDIELPPDDNSSGFIQPPSSILNEKIFEISSDTQFSNDFETCGDNDSLSRIQAKIDDSLDLNLDSQNDAISAINVFNSPFSNTLQPFSALSNDSDSLFGHSLTDKFPSDTLSILDKSPPLLLPHIPESSPFGSSSSSFNLICNKSPSLVLSQTFDIPLPDPTFDYAPSPKLDCNKKSPASDSSVKIPGLDLVLNLKSPKSDMDIDSCETTAEPTDNSIENKGLTPAPDGPDTDLSLDATEKKNLSNSRCSPGRMDSDEENQEFTTAKPKVLGKEQAKKRLMAFSLSRQSNASIIKKQNKLLIPQKAPKEKPPNPNKGVGVQEQFRATISAIEEEKKKMMQNMPNYLLMYTNSLAKVGDAPILNPGEKSVKDGDIDINAITKMILEKDEKDESKGKSNQLSPNRSGGSVPRSNSGSNNRRQTKENDDKNDDAQLKKMECIYDWKSFAESGFALDSEFRRLKFRLEEKLKQKDRSNKRSLSAECKTLPDYRPVFDYLTNCSAVMVPLKAKALKPGQTTSYKEKTLKYTLTKPVITWAENQSCATDFFMPKQMLLENCDMITASILNDVIEQRGETYVEMKKPRQKYWYPKFNYLIDSRNIEDSDVANEKFDVTPPKKNERKTKEYDEDYDDEDIVTERSDISEWKEKNSGRGRDLNWELERLDTRERRKKYETGLDGKDSPTSKPKGRGLNLVNRDYSSDEENNRNPVKELFVGDVKVQLDLGLNSVKVKSKWDSDYDDEDEKDSWNGIEKPEGKRTSLGTYALSGGYDQKSSADDTENFNKSPDSNADFISNQGIASISDSQNLDFSLDGGKGKLASEYEKFMKLVSCDVDNVKDMNSSESPFEKMKKKSSSSAIRLIMSDNKNSKNIDPTDWDLESDREENQHSKRIDSVKEDTTDSFSLLLSGYDGKTRKKSKSPARKKSDKFKSKDKSKKSGKNKKKKRKESSSESSSDSSDSGSGSDSSDSEDERRKKKKKRVKKYRKRYSSSSSSSSTSSTSSTSSSNSSSSDSKSDSDSKSSKSKNSRRAKKKNKAKKNVSGESSGSNDEMENAMLKELDLKKQQIIKKIEEIDSLDSTTKNKKKIEKTGNCKKSESEFIQKGGKGIGYFDGSKEISEETEDAVKGQKTLEKFGGGQSEDESIKGKKRRKKSKKEKWSSESSSDDNEKENRRIKTAKNLKGSRKKKAEYSSSSESDSSSYSRKSKKLRKKKKKEGEQKSFARNARELPAWNDHLLSDGSDFKNENVTVSENLSWLNNKREWNGRQRNASDDPQKAGEGLKDLGDWENSSVEETPKERRSRESTWDEELPVSGMGQLSKEGTKNEIKELIQDDRNKFLNEFDLESKSDLLFIENSGSNLAHKSSRDAYSREGSSSMQLFSSINGSKCNLNIDYQLEETLHGLANESRKEKKKPSKDELYSPGHTDSDLSDENEKMENRRESETRPIHLKEELNSATENTQKRDRPEANAVPIVSDILLPGEIKKETEEKSVSGTPSDPRVPRSEFIAIPLAKENEAVKNREGTSEKSIVLDFTNKKRTISVKLQQKFQSKVASVFQSDSEEEIDVAKKGKTADGESETSAKGKNSTSEFNEKKEQSKESKKSAEDGASYDKSKGKGKEKVHKTRWSSDNYKENSDRYVSSRCRTPSPDNRYSDAKAGKWSHDKEDIRRERDAERRSPRLRTESSSKNESKKPEEVTENVVRPIPVLTGLDVRMADSIPWNRSHMLGSEDIGFSCDHFDLMNPDMEPYKLYGSPDAKSDNYSHGTGDRGYFGGKYERNYGHDIHGTELDVLLENRIRMDKRKSRSRSSSPRKRRRSKTPERRRSPRNRSPKRRSTSPRRRGRSPFSPRRRGSPRGRRYKSSRSPERKKSRSPRKRRHSPFRRSRSISPRRHKDRLDSPRRRSISPGKDSYRDIGVRNLIHLTGMPDDENRDLCPLKYDSPMDFTRSLADSTISDSELNNAFYSGEYPGEYGGQNYPEEVTVNNLITLQNHDADKQTDSPKRLPLDQRLEIELGVPNAQGDQYQSYQQYPEHANQYPNSYQCDDGISHTINSSQNFYSNQNSDFNGQYFNGQPPSSNFDQYQQYPCHSHPPPQNSVLQVGNIMEVVPTLPPPTMLPSSKGHQIMQVGNVLQVVPSPKPTQTAPFSYGANPSPVKNQKGSPSITTTTMPNPEAIINPLIRAIQLEREKRKKEKEKRRLEREARRKARQLKREAKFMSVNEKLKKSVQDEGLMLGQEVEEDELLEDAEHPSPPVPVEIVTDSSQSLPMAGKGILITAGFIPRPASEKKEVKFADGICPGEGTSTSGGEDRASPPPKPKLPKEKRYKKKKTKLKKKVKVHIIRQVIQDEDDDDDDLPPPPPPPGDPPPVFYARFPFGIRAQYPVYQTQTTTTTFTTVQFPSESLQ